jgi:hypothetical protein
MAGRPKPSRFTVSTPPSAPWGPHGETSRHRRKPPGEGCSEELPGQLRVEPTGFGWPRPPCESVEVVAQFLRPGRVPQLGHGPGLDLADPLPAHPVDLADLVERLGLPVGEAEPVGCNFRDTAVIRQDAGLAGSVPWWRARRTPLRTALPRRRTPPGRTSHQRPNTRIEKLHPTGLVLRLRKIDVYTVGLKSD